VGKKIKPLHNFGSFILEILSSNHSENFILLYAWEKK